MTAMSRVKSRAEPSTRSTVAQSAPPIASVRGKRLRLPRITALIPNTAPAAITTARKMSYVRSSRFVKKRGYGTVESKAFAPSTKIAIAAEPTPTATPSAPPIRPHVRSRRRLTPSVVAIGVSVMPAMGTLGLARSVDCLERVADQALRTADSAGDIEASIEAPEILRGLDSFFERGLGKPER